MNTKIKLSIVSILTLLGLFAFSGIAGAATVSSSTQSAITIGCNSTTLYGNVWTSGTRIWAWFDYGPNSSLSYSTSRQGPFTSDSQITAVITGLKENTTYYYALMITDGVTVKNGGVKYFTTSSCQPEVQPPTVNIYADNTNLNYNGSTYIRWSTTNNPSCTVSGGTMDWTGTKPNSGSFYTGSLTSTKTFYISCSNSAGTASDSVTVYVNDNRQAPTVSLTVDNNNLTYGGSTNLRWSSTGTGLTCTASGGWSGNKATSGVQSTGALYSNKIYTIMCYNDVGSDYASVNVTVGSNPVTIPTVQLTADTTNLSYGGNTTLRWTTTGNPTSCTASGDWYGTKTTSGGYSNTGALYTSKNYTITCSNSAGSSSDYVTVYVSQNMTCQDPSALNYGGSLPCQYNQQYDPTVHISASSTYLNYGGSTYINWYSSYASSCYASGSGSWYGTKATSGNFYTGSLYDTKTYTIRCTGTNGSSVSDSVTIYVNDNNNNNNDYYNTPSVSTSSATNINGDRATLNGYVNSNGGNVRAWFEWGTNSSYGYTTSQTYYGNTSGTYYSYDISGLSSGQTYYFRAVAENSNGQRVYGSGTTFSTYNNNYYYYNNNTPRATTYSPNSIGNNSATLNGYIDTSNYSTGKWFEWGTNSNLSQRTNSIYSSASGNFSQTIYNLSPGTIYYYRVVANNIRGTDYGNMLSFKTLGDGYNGNTCYSGSCSPTAVTSMATNISSNSARLNGLALVDNGVYTSGYFEYGKTQALGNSTLSKSVGGNFYDGIYNLSPNTTYYYRAVVTNSYGTSHGDIVSFKTGNAVTYVNTNTNTNTVYKNTTVVSNTTNSSSDNSSKPSLVLLQINESQNTDTIRQGDYVEYVTNYKNVSSKDLKSVVLQISIPKELKFMETSRGYYSEENNKVVANIGDLNPGQEGSMRITVEVTPNAELDKITVVTANLAYTISKDNSQEEVFAYAKNTVRAGQQTIQQGALAFLFGNGFLPDNLLGWLLLILLVILMVLAVRKAYYSSRVVPVPEEIKKGH